MEIMGQMVEIADMFPLGGLIGAHATTTAKQLYAALHSKRPDLRAGAEKTYRALCDKAKRGDEKAQDLCYAIERIKIETRNA
jgi:hypothetical protein